MGRSSVAQLIAKAKAENAYNNSGIKTDAQFFDFFNDALSDLVEDIGLQETLPDVTFVVGTREYDLPDDFFSLFVFYEAVTTNNNERVVKRRNYDQEYPPGYWILNKGTGWVLDLYYYTSSKTFTGLYIRYPALLTKVTDFPEVQTVGERALIYYAIWKACMNNNESNIGLTYKGLYEDERKKIRNAAARGGM